MKAKWSISVGLILNLLNLLLPVQSVAEAALGEMILTGAVTVNQVKVMSGSTIFSGSQIETLKLGTAIINLRDGAGVLAIEPNSRLSLSGTPRHLAAKVSQGWVTVRAQAPITVTTPQVQIGADADSAYQVAVTKESTEVVALRREVRVQAPGISVSVKPGQRYSSRSGSATTTLPDQHEQSRNRRRVWGTLIPLLLGALALPLALAVSDGEQSPPVSPTTPRSRR